MQIYLKATGQPLSTSWGRGGARIHQFLPKGQHTLVLRTTGRYIPLNKKWDGGQTETYVVVGRKNYRPLFPEYDIDFPPLYHGGVEWEVDRHGDYRTMALKYRLEVTERPHNRAPTTWRAEFLGETADFKLTSLAIAMPKVLLWAKGQVRELSQHVASVHIDTSRLKEIKPTSRFDLIESL
jgi:hypothetical protein